MNFYRHWYNLNEIREHGLSDLSNLGFYDVSTGDPTEAVIFKKQLKSDPEYNTPDLYWYKDNLHKAYLRSRTTVDYKSEDSKEYSYYGNEYRFQCSNYNFYNPPYSQVPGQNWGIMQPFRGNYTYNSYQFVTIMFFIPLKNGGFILTIHHATPDTSGGNVYVKSTPRFFVMPRTDNDAIAKNFGCQNSDNYDETYITTLIGIPPTNNSILNNYLYIFSNYTYTKSNNKDIITLRNYENGWYYSNAPLFDFQTGSLSQEFKMSNAYTDPNYISEGYKNKQYMNFNPNVCVLSKVPRNNGFIDNLYYMVTCPTTEMNNDNYRGIFFSFEGRNFINIYGNMVLELPGY